jgi:putative intracellular protease/amidase
MPRVSGLMIVACFVAAGCGGSNVVPVSGTLTYKGKPVTNAFVNFVPENGRPSMGETDQNGKFTLVYDPETKGAERGKHRVFVQHNALADASQPGAIPGEAPRLSAEWREFFTKYGGDNSNVQVEITKGTSDLKLEWD